MRPRRLAPTELTLLAWGAPLHAGWEFLHSPLYADHAEGAYHVFWTRLHCTAGDAVILLVSFWVTAVAMRSRDWPWERPMAGGVLFTLLGLGYTAWSEWFNTSVRAAWTYAPAMPTLGPLGLSPLLQWVVLQPATLWLTVHTRFSETHRTRGDG